jgi:SAM-dependent methyltransferase
MSGLIRDGSRQDEPKLSAGVDEWDAHWDDFGGANERNPAQEYRRRLTLRLLERAGEPQRLLDIGAGNGELIAAAAQRWPAAELRGLELSAAAVARASSKVPSARFRVCDLFVSAPAADEQLWATHAACSEVLEHVDDPVALLRSARRWLAPGCRLVLTVPGGPMSAFDRHIGHRRHFSAQDLGAVIAGAGLEVVQLAAAGFPFFNLYRALVIARGRRLVDDAKPEASSSAVGRVTRTAMAAFRPLFLMNLPRSPAGWQTVGVAREPFRDGVDPLLK